MTEKENITYQIFGNERGIVREEFIEIKQTIGGVMNILYKNV